MFSARHVYAAIGQEIRKNGFDSISQRAKTTHRKKLGLLLLSCAQSAASLLLPGPATLYAPPLEQTKFLVTAAELRKPEDSDWSDRFISVLEQLRQRDLEQYGT
jgi:phytoene synthase